MNRVARSVVEPQLTPTLDDRVDGEHAPPGNSNPHSPCAVVRENAAPLALGTLEEISENVHARRTMTYVFSIFKHGSSMSDAVSYADSTNQGVLNMSRAVRFDEYGGIDVLKVVDVRPPVPGPGSCWSGSRRPGSTPARRKIRDGALAERWPSTFPSGEGSDLAGVVEQVGDGVDAFQAGDEVIGFTDNRAAHAELVVIEAEQRDARSPPTSPGRRPAAARRRRHGLGGRARGRPQAGDTVVVSGGAGGVGSLTVQLARSRAPR